MTVQTEISRSGPYAGSGTTGPFTVGFRFLDNSHIQVIRTSAAGIDTTLALTTDYSVSGAGGTTGTVTLVLALAFGEKLTIIRDVPFTQTADYVDNDAFPAESHEVALDLLTMQSQQNREVLDRALTLPATASSVSTELPTPQAANLIGWGSAGDELVNVPVASLGTAIVANTWMVESFNGTGAQTSFTLASSPGNTNAVMCSVSGVVQVPGVNFSVSGSTLTFLTGAPAAGTGNVSVQYGQAVATLSNPDASVLTYTPAGVGALPTTVQQQLRNIQGFVFNVKDAPYYAKGDGSTDDTAAIQAAINAAGAAGGGEVYLPAATYKFSTLSITSNFVVLRGAGKYGTRLFSTATGANCISFTGSSLAMCGLKSLGVFIIAANTGSLVVATGVFRFAMEDVFLNGAVGASNYAAGLALLSGTDVYVLNTEMVGATTFGLQTFQGNDYFIDNVTVQMNGVLGNALQVNAVTGGAVLCNNSAFLTGANCLLSNSNFLTFTNTYFDSAQGAVSVTGCTHVYFTNCEFANRVTTGSGNGGGVIFGTSANFALRASMVINNGGNGITVNSNCNDWSVIGCHIDGNNTTNAANTDGILVGGGASNFQIIGNRIGNISSGFAGHQKYGIAIGVGASNNYIIRDNIVLNNETAGLIDSGTGTNAVVENNIGYNPVGLSTVAPPATTVTYVAGHTSETIYLTGGTVTAVKIPDNAGTTVFSATPCTVHLGPGETFSITYSVAPTMNKQRH